MTLSAAYILLGTVLSLPGLALIWGVEPVQNFLRQFPRSFPAALLCFGGGAAWFLWIISQLGEADLAGFPRSWLLGIFGATAVLSFFVLKDLLAVRGLAVLLLLSSRFLLDVGFMQLPYSFVLALTCYLLIVLGIWWGAAPYIFRDWSVWILEKAPRRLAVGLLLLVLGLANFLSFALVPTPVS